jgi:hypothetical protein
LRGRNCVSNNVTYCVNVSYECLDLRWVFGITTPNPQPGGQLRVGCPRLLIQYIGIYPPNRRPFLHPQPEDVPCRGDSDPLMTA